MKATFTRTALAAASLLVALGQAQAEELSYSEIESRLAKIESQLAGQNGLQQVGYCCDSVAGCGNGCCDNSGCGDGGFGNGCCDSIGCGSGCGASSCCGDNYNACDSCWTYYAEVQLLFLRAHVPENVVGKLDESHDISPRIVFGYENSCGMGGRVRYWHYDHATDIENTTQSIAFEMNIVDLEVTQRFQGRRSDVILAGGVRLGSWDSTDQFDNTVSNDVLGLTMAVDVRSQIYGRCNRELNFVGGARMSLLGGDWEGDADHDFIDTFDDDNIFVWELYGGVEYGVCYNDVYLYTRLAYEMQMWHSAIVDSSDDLDSLGFFGPQWTIGLAF